MYSEHLNSAVNLVIDVGNSFIKLAVFQGDNILCKKKLDKEEQLIGYIKSIKKDYPLVSKAILSSVGALRLQTDAYAAYIDLFILDYDTKVPFENIYKTPKTLGLDRIALVTAAYNINPNTNVLIIDAGTCITYDFIDSDSVYLGGGISPGLEMRYKALHHFTANLPQLNLQNPLDIVGDSTNNAIHSGVVYGVVNEILGVIESYKYRYEDVQIILTGGDAKFLSKQLKSDIFVDCNFLLKGLNYVLQFNANL